MPVLTWLGVPGSAEAWTSLGFTLIDGVAVVGRVACEVGAEGWGFDVLHGDAAALGVPTRQEPVPKAVTAHANGVDRIDHVVYAVPDLDVAVDALTAVLGKPPRRRFHPRGEDGPEMAFFTVGEGFIEVVASGRPAALWGVAFGAPDLERTVSQVRACGGPIGDPKPAVQGGKIASVWKEHVGWGIAIMERPRTPAR